MAFQGKVIAVSGAASGMGLATAKHLWTLGAKLSLTDIQKEGLDAAVAAITAQPAAAGRAAGATNILAVVTDVRRSDQVDRWIARTVEALGGLDGAVNLAGVVGQHIGAHDVTQLSDEEWAFVTDINLTGAFYALRAQLRAMRTLAAAEAATAAAEAAAAAAAAAKPKPRSIVNTASTAGIAGNAFNAPYAAAKHGVVGLTRSAAKEVGRDNIRVNAIAPGIVDTPMTQTLAPALRAGMAKITDEQVALARSAHPLEVARTIAYLLGEDSTFVTGSVLVVDGGQIC